MNRTSKAIGTLAAPTTMGAALASLQPAQAEDNGHVGRGYAQTNLVSDVPGLAKVTDPNLKNSWGASTAPGLPIWVSDNNAGVTTLYDGAGQPIPLQAKPPLNAVAIPAPASAGKGAVGAPTGTVFNPTGSGFVVSEKGASGSSRFLFATEDGTIVGWSPNVDSANGIIAVDRSRVTDPAGNAGAGYKGQPLTIPGLWGLRFPAGSLNVVPGALYFTAGINDEHDGLFGDLVPKG
jgi:hypothetical protein